MFIGAQLFQFGLQHFFGLFHLLYAEIFACIRFQFLNCIKRFTKLFLNNALLPLIGQRNPFKLTVADDNCIIIACSNSSTESFSTGGFKNLFPRHQQLGIRVEVQKLRSPLLRQVIGNDKKAFLAQT